MPPRPEKDRAIRTSRDDARAAERVTLAEQWATIEAHIDEVLGDSVQPDQDAEAEEPSP